MIDIVERIRSLHYVHVPVASQLFEEAAAEIERLRLTGAERAAVEAMQAACEIGVMVGKFPIMAATLRGLLERMK